MIPIGDRLRSRTVPFVNYALIAINFLAFFYELTLSNQPRPVDGYLTTSRDDWISNWGVVPQSLMSYLHAPGSHSAELLLRLITSQFIHAGWLHILGNMLFLWVFGDNVEDALGHVLYLLFYLVCGAGAALAQVLGSQDATVPLVGASGAIAGVLGGYLLLYPRASVNVLIPIIIIPFFTRVPAWVMMLLWFFTQLISVGPTAHATGGTGGVAYLAHVGGFLLGVVLIVLLPKQRRSVIVY